MKNEKLWFKAKLYGWGWRPVAWQGWILTILYAGALIAAGSRANNQHSISDVLFNFAVPFVMYTVLFLTICHIKGERPRWRWGR